MLSSVVIASPATVRGVPSTFTTPAGQRPLETFCPAPLQHSSPNPDGWRDTPASDRLFSTARDGDVVLVTTGDGVFARE